MSDALLEWIVVIFTIAAVVNFILLIYVSRTKLGDIENYFRTTKVIVDTKRVWGAAGAIGRIHRCGMIFAVFIFASHWSKRGLVDVEEVARIPMALKLWVSIPMIASPLLIGVMAMVLKQLGRL